LIGDTGHTKEYRLHKGNRLHERGHRLLAYLERGHSLHEWGHRAQEMGHWPHKRGHRLEASQPLGWDAYISANLLLVDKIGDWRLKRSVCY